MFRASPLCLLAISLSAVAAAAPVPAGHVVVEICGDGLGPLEGGWPRNPAVSERFSDDAFGWSELPHKYIATGVRADRAMPTLVRATASVALPAGRNRLLLRARGASRLSVAGRQVLATPFWQPGTFAKGNGGGHPMDDQADYLNLGPDFRFAPPGTREAWCELELPGGAVEFILETIIGGLEPKSKRPFRPELGETVVAFSPPGSESWWLVSPGDTPVRYNDAGWAAYAAAKTDRFAALNARARAARRAEHAAYWQRRRDAAQRWLASTDEVSPPPLPAGFSAANPVDHFIADRIARAAREYVPARPGEIDFHRDVRPVLEARCLTCHQGGKARSGLRLDTRAGALRGGNGDGPAIVAGRPEDSPIFQRITSGETDERMPAKGDPLTAGEIDLFRRWIASGAPWPEFQETNFTPTPLADDLTFLRRASLDVVGLVPDEGEIRAFLADARPDRRARTIDRLLADPRSTDHGMGYWLDVLAENPNLINPTLNNTGPFRWWIHESLLDNKPLDLFATELVRLEGSERFGGPAGFGVASQNDVPMAAKGIIVASAFLGVEMKCARCHDAPTHSAKQRELFGLGAMLNRQPLDVPATSSVALHHLQLGGREAMIEVTLPPGTKVDPAWPFARFCDESTARALAEHPDDSRDVLAAAITAPQNERFAQVMANRIWQRLMGRGLVESVGDWEKAPPSHPELLRWLGRELVRSGYDGKALARLILNSHAYQRSADPALHETGALFVARAPRRFAAEQLVDSLFAATGKPFAVEEGNIDVDSSRLADTALSFGPARRTWNLGSTSNERDRPSLALPRFQAVTEVLEAFGWRGARPDALSGVRDTQTNVLQPALLSNGVMMTWLTRLSDDHGMTHLALEDQPLATLLDRVFFRLFTRRPTPAERQAYGDFLGAGYDSRLRPAVAPAETGARRGDAVRVRPRFVSWSNHMVSEANELKLKEEEAARRGDPPTARLTPDWRSRFEDFLWALLNAPEMTRIL